MVLLGLFIPQAQATVTGGSIANSVNEIFGSLVKVGDGKSPFDIGASAIAEQFNEVAVKMCAAFGGKGNDTLTGLPLAYGQCEEAMVGAEMSLIGNSSSTNLRSYAGLGGMSTTALTAAEEAAVIAADAGAIPGLFLANSALCGLLVAVIQNAAQDSGSASFCSALESAAQSHESSSSSGSASATSTPTSTSASFSSAKAYFNSQRRSPGRPEFKSVPRMLPEQVPLLFSCNLYGNLQQRPSTIR